MQVCTSLQTDNHASTPPLIFFTGRMPFLPPNQQCQSTEGKFVADSLLQGIFSVTQLLFFSYYYNYSHQIQLIDDHLSVITGVHLCQHGDITLAERDSLQLNSCQHWTDT